jgi:L-galactose dehydrogenase
VLLFAEVSSVGETHYLVVNTAGIMSGQKIPKRPLKGNPRLPATVSMVGLGCSSFSGFFAATDDESNIAVAVETLSPEHSLVREWLATVRYAVLEAGISVLDTAPWYGHGSSEVVVGWALQSMCAQDNMLRKSLTLNTKVGRYEADPAHQFDFSKQATLASVQRSLARMHVEYIDVLQLHDPEFSPSLDILLDETIPAMLQCRALGLTGYPLAVQYQICQASLERFPDMIVWDQALVYSHWNLHDTSLFTGRLPNTDNMSMAKYCQEHQVALVAAAPLSMGLLTRAGPPAWHPASQKLYDACRCAAALCAPTVDVATLAIVVALAHPGIPCTLLGMKDVAQVKTVQALAQRFHIVDLSQSFEAILSQVLTPDEKEAYQRVADPIEGPFAVLWRDGGYQWDGVQHARNFWKQVPEQLLSNWQLE